MAKGDPKGGRPYALVPDETTLKQVRGLGKLHATSKDCAGFFGVSEPTWIAFRQRCPEVVETFEQGEAEGCLSLRRNQFRMAENSVPMAIFLGKNYLGQSDKQDHAVDLSGEVKTDSDPRALAKAVAALLSKGLNGKS